MLASISAKRSRAEHAPGRGLLDQKIEAIPKDGSVQPPAPATASRTIPERPRKLFRDPTPGKIGCYGVHRGRATGYTDPREALPVHPDPAPGMRRRPQAEAGGD